ncbi:MAG: UvrB/UvrC motif-containing protein [Kiritimatiellia bacterium]|nr:UvrB/UvrC motif-containing protein [Kiritimatiellia bacterium]
MKCEICQEEDATVHLTQVLDGSVKKLHLCETCAAESGVDIQSPVSIADLFVGLNKSQPREQRIAGPACPGCGLKPADFKKTGRLGCPQCYETFAERLAPLIRAMQRGDRHVGKTPGDAGAARPPDADELKRRLDQAIAEERFEDAAQWRDRLAEWSRKPPEADPKEKSS